MRREAGSSSVAPSELPPAGDSEAPRASSATGSGSGSGSEAPRVSSATGSDSSVSASGSEARRACSATETDFAAVASLLVAWSGSSGVAEEGHERDGEHGEAHAGGDGAPRLAWRVEHHRLGGLGGEHRAGVEAALGDGGGVDDRRRRVERLVPEVSARTGGGRSGAGGRLRSSRHRVETRPLCERRPRRGRGVGGGGREHRTGQGRRGRLQLGGGLRR